MAQHLNGSTPNGIKPGVVLHDLMSGVQARVIPLSPYLRLKMVAYTEQEYPFDESPWRKPLENSIVPNDSFVDKDDPGYLEAWRDVLEKRNALLTRCVIEESVTFEQSPEELVVMFADKLQRIRKYNSDDESDWDIVLWQILIGSNQDLNTIYNIASCKAVLTEVEVNDAIRIFRPALSGAGLLQLAKQP